MTKSPNNLFKKKVLVTGASGFIGTHLCRGLVTTEAEVYGSFADCRSRLHHICSGGKAI